MSNGEDMAKAVQGMSQSEKLVFLITEVGNMKSALLTYSKAMNSLGEKLTELHLSVIKLPSHCIHEEEFRKFGIAKTRFDSRLDELEKDKAGRDAITKILFGASGLSVLGIVTLVLKVFGVF